MVKEPITTTKKVAAPKAAATKAPAKAAAPKKVAVPSVSLGQAVEYVSTKGHTKLAIVTALPSTVTPGTSLPELSAGYLHLHVISPAGTHGKRLSVPFEGTAKALPSYVATEQGPRGVWKLLK